MKKTVKILIITAVVMILLGIALCIGGAMAGGLSMAKDVLKDVSFLNYEKNHDHHLLSVETEMSTEVINYRTERAFFKDSDVSALNIEAVAAELVLISSDTNEIEVISEEGELEAYTKNQVLHVKSDARLKGQKITVYIPGDYKFREIDIDAGASAIRFEKLFADFVDIEIGAGAVQIDEIETNEAEFEIGAGEIIVSKGKINHCSIDIGMGNFEYSGSIEKECDVECDMGNADIYLVDASKNDYNYKIEVGAGEVTVGDESFGGLAAEKHRNHHADSHMDIECGIGSVNIEF